jgi:hypothetical protein
MMLGNKDFCLLAILRIAKSYFTIWNTGAEKVVQPSFRGRSDTKRTIGNALDLAPKHRIKSPRAYALFTGTHWPVRSAPSVQRLVGAAGGLYFA